MIPAKVVVFRGRKRFRQAWFFHVVAPNGRILCTSEAYTNLSDCFDAAEVVAGPLPIVEAPRSGH